MVTSKLCSPGCVYVGFVSTCSMVAASRLYRRGAGALEVPPVDEVPP